MLDKREADFSSAALTSTNLRSDSVDFTVPVYRDLSTIMIPHDEDQLTDMHYTAFFDAFGGQAWIITFVSLVALTVAYSLIRALKVDRLHFDVDSERFSQLNSMALVYSVFLQRDYQFKKRRLSTKITFITTCIFCFLIYTMYTATFTSTIISRPVTHEIETFDELIREGYKLMLFANTAQYDWFSQAPSGTLLHKAYTEMVLDNEPDSLFSSTEEAIQHLTRGSKVAVFDYTLPFQDLERVKVLKNFKNAIESSICFGLTKDSEFKEAFKLSNQETEGDRCHQPSPGQVGDSGRRQWKNEAEEADNNGRELRLSSCPLSVSHTFVRHVSIPAVGHVGEMAQR